MVEEEEYIKVVEMEEMLTGEQEEVLKNNTGSNSLWRWRGWSWRSAGIGWWRKSSHKTRNSFGHNNVRFNGIA